METPLSARRITRSQTKATVLSNISSRKHEEQGKESTKKSKTQRPSLIDITNGSPIVGLAISNSTRTPISLTKSNNCKKTPGSGEALLRGQVINLLQNAEQVSEISKFLSFDTCCGRSSNGFLGSVLESPNEEQVTRSEVVSVSESVSEKDVVSRSSFMDFSDKSDCSSVMAFQGSEEGIRKKSSMKGNEADDQMNVSPQDDELFDEDGEVEEGEAESHVWEIDELCQGMKNVRVEEEVKFTGKHTWFVYNNDDDLVMEEEVLNLKGLPTPKGKHLRFQDE